MDKRSEYAALTDEALVELSRKGDEYAFNVLAGRYLNTRSHSTKAAFVDCDDFVQEGMFGFLKAVKRYDPSRGASFKSFASVCMKNSITDAIPDIIDTVSVDDNADTITNIQSVDDPLKHIIASEQLSEVLSACQSSLSVLEKTVVFLRASGASYDEIGQKLNLTSKAVDNAVQRARHKLKKVITPEG